MSTEVSGMIECKPWAHVWEGDDEDPGWQAGIDLCLLNTGNAYDALACLFGVRNSFGFQPLTEGRGLPRDASDGLRDVFAAEGGPEDVWGTTWISWAELAAANWDETDRSGGFAPKCGHQLSRGEQDLIGLLLVGDWAEVVQAGVSSSGVVAGDPPEDLQTGLPG
ncbi:hypothetical protein Pth03_73850 [Planotetraspora thailandica]|uniref:Uncharacterized protein n=1 Tax=Planotetraspora thailandica TaxID=487172 RepID=A0A8J4DEM1_9ACTN|nr:hypothetical protein Pth03_73850 [Planotetraspora thailandica]